MVPQLKKTAYFSIIFLGVFLASLLFGDPALGDIFKIHPLEVIEIMDYGEVNWSKMTIRAKGDGIPNPQVSELSRATLGADQEAKQEALNNLLKTIKAVPIDSRTTFQQKIKESDVISSKVQELVRNAEIIETTYFSDGGVKIVVNLPLSGPLINLILPTTERTVPVTTDKKKYTGMIIDVRGLKAAPVLAPKIMDEEGKEVYGSSFISLEGLGKWGVAKYLRDLSSSQKDDRVGKNPLLVKGLRATGPRSGDIIISNADAQKILGFINDQGFLRNGEVIIIIN
ncbi:MAG: LPP20 family lipoprotein [Deltaproteobacteria bacterium]|nr:MAG: LPP20 family lipoprotein [Deltaproteobacteria bacterium]